MISPEQFLDNRLIQGRAYLAAGANVLVSVCLCLLGCGVGLAVARAITR